jgi:hypothetical protein
VTLETVLDLTAPPLPPVYCLGGCGRLLTASESRARGYGPECAEKLGIPAPQPSRFSRRDGGDCPGQADLLEEAR